MIAWIDDGVSYLIMLLFSNRRSPDPTIGEEIAQIRWVMVVKRGYCDRDVMVGREIVEGMVGD